MILPPEQHDLAVVTTATALMWLPYTCALIAQGGLKAAIGNRSCIVSLPAWAERAKRAHANAIENLVLFAPAVLLATALQPDQSGVAVASQIYLAARLVHYFAYVGGVLVVRTLAFLTGWCATLAIIAMILS